MSLGYEGDPSQITKGESPLAEKETVIIFPESVIRYVIALEENPIRVFNVS